MPISTSLAAIIEAVFAALGGFIGTMSTGLWLRHNEEFKRPREERDAVRKYYDPLLRASQHLQSRIWVLCQRRIAKIDDVAKEGIHSPWSFDYTFTLFLFGQFFAWNMALRNDVHGLHHTPREEDVNLLNVLYKIERVFHDPSEGSESTFQIYTGMQNAIGEIMLSNDSNNKAVRCLGYADFITKWVSKNLAGAGTAGLEFQAWFFQITTGMSNLDAIKEEFPSFEKTPPNVPPNFPYGKLHRLILLQHLLVELIRVLDPDQRRTHEHGRDLIPISDKLTLKCDCRQCHSPDLRCTNSNEFFSYPPATYPTVSGFPSDAASSPLAASPVLSQPSHTHPGPNGFFASLTYHGVWTITDSTRNRRPSSKTSSTSHGEPMRHKTTRTPAVAMKEGSNQQAVKENTSSKGKGRAEPQEASSLGFHDQKLRKSLSSISETSQEAADHDGGLPESQSQIKAQTTNVFTLGNLENWPKVQEGKVFSLGDLKVWQKAPIGGILSPGDIEGWQRVTAKHLFALGKPGDSLSTGKEQIKLERPRKAEIERRAGKFELENNVFDRSFQTALSS